MIDTATLRRFVYDDVIATGAPPSSGRIATQFGTTAAEARATLASLKIGKTILIHPTTGEIWMAGPFSASPTPYEISGARSRWFGNCVWDMLGVAVLVNEPVKARASCVDCGEPFSAAIDPQMGFTSDWVAHFLLPARQWYDDVGFT